MPPAIALATTSQNCDQASRVMLRTRGFCNRAAMITHATVTHSTVVSMRLENSITAWMPMAGVGVMDVASQVGQVGHPRPDPVTRTMPPPRTIRMLTTSVAVAAQRRARGESVYRSASQPRGVCNALVRRSPPGAPRPAVCEAAPGDAAASLSVSRRPDVRFSLIVRTEGAGRWRSRGTATTDK